jgi:hypothetical protein
MARLASVNMFEHYIVVYRSLGTYDHRSVKTGHPVRSAIHKH